MIPKIIHQTWRDENIPDKYQELIASWKENHPQWAYRLWTDGSLDQLVREQCPKFLAQFRAYSNPVQRADAGRYLVLQTFGGVYCDLDTRCLMPLDLLCNEDRIVLAHEPQEHFAAHIDVRRFDHILFNGTMASPKGHPFWRAMMREMKNCRHGSAVLDTTGPLVLTGCALRYDDPDGLSINSCHIFNPLTSDGNESLSPVFGDYGAYRLSVHYWHGNWFRHWKQTPYRKAKKLIRQARYHLTRGAYLSSDKAQALVDYSVLATPVDEIGAIEDQKISILVPVRDGEPFLDRCVELMRSIEHPKSNIKITFCEGNSMDHSWRKLQDLAAEIGTEFAEVSCIRKNVRNQFPRSKRWKPALQKKRRSGLARVRNHLIDEGLAANSEWALWIDADVCDYPPDILKKLLAEREKIVVPNCVLDPGGATYDLNSFTVTDESRDSGYYKHVHAGLYVPPSGAAKRLYFHDVKYCDRVEMFGVGATMLLVHASVHRAGIRFPEIPYQDLLETEGFGYWARDCGINPVGLPNVEIRHERS